MKQPYAHIGHPLDRLTEECAELILAIAKAKRFGLFHRWPEKESPMNADRIIAEIDDVYRQAMMVVEYIKNTHSVDQETFGDKGIHGKLSDNKSTL